MTYIKLSRPEAGLYNQDVSLLSVYTLSTEHAIDIFI